MEKIFKEIIVPSEVYQELSVLTQFNVDIRILDNASWIHIATPTNIDRVNQLMTDLDLGESQAIALAEELEADFLLIDDLKGRKKAEDLGIEIIGSIGILVKAKQMLIIPEVKKYLDHIIQIGFWINPAFYQNILRQVGEL